jgi:DNA-binding NtrC family response regulator
LVAALWWICHNLGGNTLGIMANKLLVIDDDEASCRLVKATFSAEGIDVVMAHDGPAGLERAAVESPDVVLLDVRMPTLDGLEVLERLKAASPSLPVVMLTAERDVKTAVRATQLGAFDYLTKPIDHEEIVVVVRRALETRALRLEVEDLRRRVGKDEGDNLARLMGPSAAIQQIVERVRVVAASTFTVLILGETGTGKELVSQAIHRQSDRRRKPFIALDCGAIPEQLLESELFGHEKGAFTGADRRKTGRFQLAEGGTCFLDEMGNLPMSLQAKLLRVLESKQVQPVGAERATAIDIRFVAATNHDLQVRVADGAFRADLFFRLAQYTISLPPLRQRPDDIQHLARRFVEETSVELRRPVQELMPEAIELLLRHDWPGNVRELRNVVRQAVLQTRELVIRREHMTSILTADRAAPASAPQELTGKSLREIAEDAARNAERHAIGAALRAAKGNKSHAAKALQTDYKTLHLKMQKLGIRAHDFLP